MPIRFQYDPVLKILIATAKGLVSLRDIETHLDEEKLERALGHRELIDATSATTDMTADQVRLVLERLRRLLKNGPLGPTAVVADNNSLIGLATMLAILSDLNGGPSVGVFRNYNDALNWLLRS